MFLNSSHFFYCGNGKVSLKTVGLALLVMFISNCSIIPADPNKSFENAIKAGLSVGYASNPPWVIDSNGNAEGIEADIVKGFAKANGMKIKWEKGPEQKLMKKLEKKELHIVITGMTKDNPWKSEKIGITMPYYKEKKVKRIIAVQQGENRLTMNLEKYFFENKASITSLINENKPEF